MTLPSSKQTWAHSTVSKNLLDRALEDPTITAIETDILLGRDTTVTIKRNDDGNSLPTGSRIPITAHPPDTESDLSVYSFFESIRGTNHHVKLDFKEQAAVPPTLELLQTMLSNQEHDGDRGIAASDSNHDSKSNNREDRTFFLNADILPGPGMEDHDLNVRAQPFLEAAAAFASTLPPSSSVALSLGWRVDVCHPSGYTADHMEQMKGILRDNEIPVVLAVNARLLAKSQPEPFVAFLLDHGSDGQRETSSGPARGQRQLLIWTGAGEPPIGLYTLHKLQELFGKVSEQVGYDVQTTDNTLEAFAYDAAMWFLGWKNKIVRTLKQS